MHRLIPGICFTVLVLSSAALAVEPGLESAGSHWAFRPLRPIEPPAVSDSAWPRTAIDRFVLAALEARGLRPSTPAAPAKLARRFHFDVTGLPPSPDEVASFGAAASSDPDGAIAALAGRLLDRPEYGERWARHWLDVARYADSSGQEQDADRPNAYHYRDFVIRALNDDMPFDRFVRWQLAGDEYEPDDPLALAATGFLTGGPSTKLTVPMEEEKQRNRYNELDDMLSTIGTGLLGLTIGCARCHDHKYDAVPARDYYSMLTALHSGDRGDVLLGTRAEVGLYRQQRAEWQAEMKAAESQLGDWLGRAREKLEPALRRSKVEKLEIQSDQKVLLLERSGSDAARALERKHAKALRVSDDDLRKAIAGDERSELDALDGKIAEVRGREPASPPVALAFRDFGPEPAATWLFHRGDFRDRSEPAHLGFLTVFANGKSAADYLREARADRPLDSSTYQRKALASWITDVEHGAGALLARVIVNRIWQHHFGEGLVRTPGDFGVEGDRPSHPELLEWLAHDLVAHGWKLKRLHRLMLTSAVYSQGSALDPEGSRLDPENRLLSRRRPRRLEAEALRDAMLLVSGTLNPETYGPAFKPPIQPEAMVARNLGDPYPKNARDTPATRRRSIYMFHKRVIPYPLLQAFDAPDSLQSCSRRERTTVPTQALALLNDPFVRVRALDFAGRLEREAGDSLESRLARGYLLALGREPTATERAASLEFLSARGERRGTRQEAGKPEEARRLALADFCQVLFGLNEFEYVD